MPGRKTAERALAESAERSLAIIDALEEGVVLHEADGTIFGCNASACRILGLAEEQILGRTLRDAPWRALREDGAPLEPESHPAAITLLTGQPCSHVAVGIERPGAPCVWLSVSSRPLHHPGEEEPFAAVVSFSDITQRKPTEEELRTRASMANLLAVALEQEELRQKISKSSYEWRITFDAMPHPVLLMEPDGRLIRLNEAARELAGLPFLEVLRHSVGTIRDGEPWRTIASLLQSEETTAQVRDEEGRTWDLSLSPVTSPDGQRGVVVVARDLTDLVRLQESLRRSETMSAMGVLVAGVAHEVRNPLFGISATLSAFTSRFKRRTEYHRYVEVLQGAVDRLSALMEDLLDYGKPLRLVLEPAEASEVIRAAVAACAALAEQARVEVEIANAADAADADSNGLPILVVDRKRMVQVFQNLLENAIQHSPPGGRVVVRACPAGEPAGVLFAVEDAGPGFQAEDLPHVFEPFFTRRRGGTGLGLSIVQRIVEQHRGEITAANRPEGGGVMTVRLPSPPPPLPRAGEGEKNLVTGTASGTPGTSRTRRPVRPPARPRPGSPRSARDR